MLAQSFQSAADLRISDAEHRSLIKVLGLLERGDLIDAPQRTYCDNGFSMETQGRGCGTPACIGGWVATLMGVDQMSYVDSYMFDQEKNEGLYQLYWGTLKASVSQAAVGLRSYLTTGDPKWDEAVA